MVEKYTRLRTKYSQQSYDDLKDVANTLCKEAHNGKSFIEVYQNDFFSMEDLVENIIKMHRRLDLQKMNEQVTSQKEVLNKPVEYIQSELKVVPDSTTTFLDLWRKKWDMRIIHQDIPRDLYCLSFLSQLFIDKTIYRGVNEDIRLHLCTIMPSGTGKSDANNVLAEVCKLAGKSTYFVNRYTDAVLTGSVDSKKIERNIKNKLEPGMLGYQDPIQHSILELYDIVFYDEAENILKTTSATEGAQRHLQTAMNRLGSETNKITNSLVGNSIESYPSCNIIMTSYFLEEFAETLLKRGLLQRMVVYIQNEDEAKRTGIINRIVDSVPTFEEDVAEAEEKQKEYERLNNEVDQLLLAEIKSLLEYHKNTKSIYLKKEANPVIKEIIMQLREILPLQSNVQREVWNAMISRLSVNILKMSALFALMNYRNYIIEQDVRNAATILIKTMDSVGFFLKGRIMSKMNDSTSLAFHTSLKKSEKFGIQMEEEELIEYMMKRFSIDRDKCRINIDALINAKKINVNNKDGVRKLKVIA